MLEFIKMFGLGIVYTILSPFILALFLLFVVYSLFNYLVCEVIYLGTFFLGKKFDDTTELEKKLIKIKKQRELESQQTIESANEIHTQVSSNNEDGDLNV